VGEVGSVKVVEIGGRRERRGRGGDVTFAGMSMARSGMWRSPITRTRRDVIFASLWRARRLVCGWRVMNELLLV